jgi:hypothetical protein
MIGYVLFAEPVKGVTKGPDCQTVPDELSKIAQVLNEK